MEPWQTYLQEQQSRFVEELRALVQIPSVSALPQHQPDIARAAVWMANRLSAAGLEHAQVMPTANHPVVYADWLHAPGKPTVLIYGHYDVQPADPFELWEHPPFAGEIVNDRMVGRGASDNKGNILAAIIAVEALMRTAGGLPVNVKFMVEGEEEIGSPALAPWVAAQRALLACDVVLNADLGQYSETQPGLSLGLRGLAGMQLDVTGPAHDLHSGSYGGAVQNPIHALVALLASMRGADGRIQVEGFYDAVEPLDAQTRADIAAVPYDEAAFKGELGLSALYGEAGYTPIERIWARPTLEVNGIWGGFQDEGSKTVLPAEAHAKITCRLVPKQDPEEILRLITDHVARHCPPGVTATVRSLGEGAWPYGVSRDHPVARIAFEVLAELYGVAPLYTRAGGTVPVCAVIERYLEVSPISFGFGLTDELIHAPNEFFRLSSFRRAQQAYAMILPRLAEMR
jgi:acetylornithine deacetylase/succinyl-diaminopimelate desuccinylase-like protein